MGGDNGLTEPQIDHLVRRYHLEMARYEKTAAAVAERIRRELRAEARLRYLLSFRAKHPEDLRGKLRRKAAKYAFEALNHDLNQVVTDLAGCRVVDYRAEDQDVVVNVIDRLFASPARDDARPGPRRDATGYRATHRLVLAPEGHEHDSIRDAICEVQVTTLAAHLFNELEHDIVYKDHGQPASEPERELIDELRGITRTSDRLVELLFRQRSDVAHRGRVLESAEALRFALERAADRPLTGDFARLFRMLDASIQPLNFEALTAIGKVSDILDRGAALVKAVGIPEVDDVIYFVMGIFDRFAFEFAETARSWDGPSTPLQAALLRMIVPPGPDLSKEN